MSRLVAWVTFALLCVCAYMLGLAQWYVWPGGGSVMIDFETFVILIEAAQIAILAVVWWHVR